jgi:hypothetical protein
VGLCKTIKFKKTSKPPIHNPSLNHKPSSYIPNFTLHNDLAIEAYSEFHNKLQSSPNPPVQDLSTPNILGSLANGIEECGALRPTGVGL